MDNPRQHASELPAGRFHHAPIEIESGHQVHRLPFQLRIFLMAWRRISASRC